jgi:hypothetical protein
LEFLIPRYHKLNLKGLLLLRDVVWVDQILRFEWTNWLKFAVLAVYAVRANQLSFGNRRV